MNQPPEINLIPSLEEFTGWYNIQGDYGDGHPVVRSRWDVPEFEHWQLFDLYPIAAKWFAQLGQRPAGEVFDPLAGPAFFVRSDADDRTLCVDADFGLLTVAQLKRIKDEFLADNPLWRVVLVAEHPSCSIVVYPTAIRYGSEPTDLDPSMALGRIVARNRALVEERQRPQRAFLSQLQQLIPRGVQAFGTEPYSICGVLDNHEGDYERLTVCLLIRGSETEQFHIDGPEGVSNHFMWRSASYGVDANGVIVSYIDVPDGTPFSLNQWLPPADYRGPLRILEVATGQQFPYELKSEDIIRTKPANGSASEPQ